MSKELAEAVKLFISQPLNFPLSRGQIMEVARIALPILEQQDYQVIDGRRARFRKKPVVIEAIQWTGLNLHEVIAFTDGPPEIRSHHAGMMWDNYSDLVKREGLKIYTLEGVMGASVGDWIIKGVKGEHYPCKPDVFDKTYEPADEAAELEQQESDGDIFIVMRNPGKVPDIKRPVGDVADYLLELYQYNPDAVCDVVTYRFAGVSGQWVQDGRELLAMAGVVLEQQERGERQERGEWIEWKGGEQPVNGDVLVETKWSDGSVSRGEASDWRWEHHSLLSNLNLIAYRIIPEQPTNQNGEQ